ncbi:MAG: methylmalonyl-CoA mutase family protein, partial [Pseudomonadota bacterium]
MDGETTFLSWRALADKTLKGAPYESLQTPLRTITGEDGAIDPFAGAHPPIHAGRATTSPWWALQRVDTDDGAEQALDDLVNGATGLALVFAGAPSAVGRGLTANSSAELGNALAGVDLSLVPVHVEAGERAPEALALLLSLAGERESKAPAEVHAGFDPVGVTAFSGQPIALPMAEAVLHFEANGLAG